VFTHIIDALQEIVKKKASNKQAYKERADKEQADKEQANKKQRYEEHTNKEHSKKTNTMPATPAKPAAKKALLACTLLP
jgi:hypothetical protein